MDQEFDNLKTLSKNLAHAQDSNDVQVYYYNADYLKSVGSLNFDTSKNGQLSMLKFKMDKVPLILQVIIRKMALN